MHYLLQRHEERMKLAKEHFGDAPICPDCYRPTNDHDVIEGQLECESALFWAMTAEM